MGPALARGRNTPTYIHTHTHIRIHPSLCCMQTCSFCMMGRYVSAHLPDRIAGRSHCACVCLRAGGGSGDGDDGGGGGGGGGGDEKQRLYPVHTAPVR